MASSIPSIHPLHLPSLQLLLSSPAKPSVTTSSCLTLTLVPRGNPLILHAPVLTTTVRLLSHDYSTDCDLAAVPSPSFLKKYLQNRAIRTINRLAQHAPSSPTRHRYLIHSLSSARSSLSRPPLRRPRPLPRTQQILQLSVLSTAALFVSVRWPAFNSPHSLFLSLRLRPNGLFPDSSRRALPLWISKTTTA